MTIELTVSVQQVPEGVEALLDRVAEACLAVEGISNAYASVELVDADRIQALNRTTRHVDAVTDVLSYPSITYRNGTAKDHLKALSRTYDPGMRKLFLGDIALCVTRAEAQAAEYGHSLVREMGYLTAHAMFHLMGYDHMTESDRAVMRAREDEAMTVLGLPRREEAVYLTDDALFAQACEAMRYSYSPYSRYAVGACLLADDGRTFTGSNIENAAYGATLCAERCAIAHARMHGATHFSAIAIASAKDPAWPCGTCRQVLHEFAPTMRVLVGTPGNGYQTRVLSELLPDAFGLNARKESEM